MGCCMSTTTTKSPKPNPDSPKSKLNGGASPPPPPLPSPPLPPPPPVEEETVKEVLSETSIPKPPIPTPNNSYKNHPNKLQAVVEEVKIQPTAAIKPSDEIISVSEVSDLSELCSYSESLSTVTEKRDDIEGEVTQRLHRSPAKRVIRKRPPMNGGVRSPARRSEPSPVKRTPIAQGRTTTTARRNVGPQNVYRRDPGESSARRSRSPVPRGETGPRRPVRSTVTPTGRYAEGRTLAARGNGEGRTQTAIGNGEGRTQMPRGNLGAAENSNDEVVVPETATAEECLENPNVSLECFIFL